MRPQCPAPEPPVLPHQDTAALVAQLRRQIEGVERGTVPEKGTVLSSGCSPLDRLLPAGGFRRGTLIEYVGGGDRAQGIGDKGQQGTGRRGSAPVIAMGVGATTLAVLAAREACREGRSLVILDQQGEFYPPAALAAGMAPERLLLVRPADAAEALWAVEQALRCSAVGAVLAWPARLAGRPFRRLQLAAEAGGGLGLLVRPPAAADEPSWAEVRLQVAPLPSEGECRGRRLRIAVARCRGGNAGEAVEVEIHDETLAVSLVPRLAPAAARRA